MYRTVLEREMARMERIRAASNWLRGTKNKREAEALVGLRYRIVAECQAYIENEIKHLQAALHLAAITNNFTKINALSRIVTTLTILKNSMQITVGDERRFLELPVELQKDASEI